MTTGTLSRNSLLSTPLELPFMPLECLKQIDTHGPKPLFILIEIENLPGSCSFYGNPEYQRILNSLKTNREAEHERVRKWLEENDM